MKLFAIGLGGCGRNILDIFLWFDRRSRNKIIASHLAIDSTKMDFKKFEKYIRNTLLIGDGNGTGGDISKGEKWMKENLETENIINKIDMIGLASINSFLILTGFGGGTSGGTVALATELKARYASIPVYCLGTLPEDETKPAMDNAKECFSELYANIDNFVDNIILFDNKHWGDIDRFGYKERNKEIVKRLRSIFIAGEIVDSTVDRGDVISTLAVKEGISTIGYSSERLKMLSLFTSRATNTDEINAKRILRLTEKAISGRLTMQSDISSAKKALVIAAGPEKRLSNEGVRRAEEYLAEHVIGMDKDIRGGQYPLRTNEVAVTVLFSGVKEIQRFQEVLE